MSNHHPFYEAAIRSKIGPIALVTIRTIDSCPENSIAIEIPAVNIVTHLTLK
jgi:hypothetical protein